MPLIDIDGLVSFAPNVGVLVHKSALDCSPEQLSSVIKLAYSHMNDKPLCEACHGGSGPLAKYSVLNYAEYLSILRDIEVTIAGKATKKTHSQLRRKEFNNVRSQLVLLMIDNGVPYICAHPDCDITEHLTVDHIVPLSRGGSDELANLRFLCRTHNSAKGDKPI